MSLYGAQRSTRQEMLMNEMTQREWGEVADSHFQRVHAFAQEARVRASRHEKHPVYDFLTKYYPFSLGKFEKWQPGYGVQLEGGDRQRFSEKWYLYNEAGTCWVEPSIMRDKDRTRLRFIHNLLSLTASRTPVYSCFGLHEWAMVYTGGDVRHRESAPLRLSQEEIDEVVRSRSLVCTHFDAYRFFSPEAQPMNKHQPSLEDRESLEQPACIHANMDLYKWASKAMPWVGSDLVWDCFQLALEARAVDMRASPYDLSEWGYEPIRIETETGRSDYMKCQRRVEAAGHELRDRLIALLGRVLQHEY